MINILKKNKNILIIGLVVVAAFIAYTIFFTPDTSNPLQAQGATGEQAAVEQELIGLLLELRSITLDTAVFEDSRFKDLQDFSQEIVAEPVGRTNPFAPISP